jgi:hypothetical protein
MPSASPASAKRPSMHERSASGQSLSSSGKQQPQIHKAHRPHIVGRHSRTVSGKIKRTDSGANITANANRNNHQRKKSGASTPGQSPRSPGPLTKRNSSHVTLPKNHSAANLRKNHSATILGTGRQGSHINLKKQGLAPTPKPKEENQKTGFFELGDQSSGEEEEGEWEDSTTQSPELTRNNSKANSKSSTPARIPTPDEVPRKISDATSSKILPASQLRPDSASRPTAKQQNTDEASHPNPDLLQQARRGSRAPPAMSTVSAVAGLSRTDSNRSFQQINHSEAASTPDTPALSVAEGSASADKAVSRFLKEPSTSSDVKSMIDDASDEESATFLNNYKPQPSQSPEKPRSIAKARFSSIPSRTQQRLELERTEQLRAPGGPTTPPASTLHMGGPSTFSLHSRSGSRGRTRSYIDDSKALKLNYATAVRQLNVVRRFRNPIVESLTRLKNNGSLPADTGVITPKGAASTKSRPPSRRTGQFLAPDQNNRSGISRSLEEQQNGPSPLASRSSSRGRGGRVQFQRQGSPDDIGITPTGGSVDGADDDGLTPDEALMRRLWNSRDVYDNSAVSTP